jgi:hypothetical protein
MISMEITATKKGIRVIGIILLVYALLVATHEGEFWPFSIYPMFSQAGNPWTRAMVLDVTDQPEELIWEKHSLENRKWPPVPVRQYGVDQIDFSNFISKTENWTEPRKAALNNMFGPFPKDGVKWMTVKVHGQLVGKDSVAVTIEPWLLITEDGVFENPNLDSSLYIGGGQQ